MQNNISCLLEACEQLARHYEIIDAEQNFVRVRGQQRWHYFEINKTPLNSEVEYGICKDKMHSYELLSGVLNMPKTLAFLDFQIEEKYRQYLSIHTPTAAIELIEQQLDYPLVVKCNSGALGERVYSCSDAEAVASALENIFDRHSRAYDYVALAQQQIEHLEEFRLVCLFQQPVLLYRRGSGALAFNAKYWEQGESAELVDDSELLAELCAFIQPLFQELAIAFVGLDIMRSRSGELYLLELNASPKFDHVIENGGRARVVNLYRRMLERLE